jgi:hypothetical protein
MLLARLFPCTSATHQTPTTCREGVPQGIEITDISSRITAGNPRFIQVPSESFNPWKTLEDQLLRPAGALQSI